MYHSYLFVLLAGQKKNIVRIYFLCRDVYIWVMQGKLETRPSCIVSHHPSQSQTLGLYHCIRKGLYILSHLSYASWPFHSIYFYSLLFLSYTVTSYIAARTSWKKHYHNNTFSLCTYLDRHGILYCSVPRVVTVFTQLSVPTFYDAYIDTLTRSTTLQWKWTFLLVGQPWVDSKGTLPFNRCLSKKGLKCPSQTTMSISLPLLTSSIFTTEVWEKYSRVRWYTDRYIYMYT